MRGYNFQKLTMARSNEDPRVAFVTELKTDPPLHEARLAGGRPLSAGCRIPLGFGSSKGAGFDSARCRTPQSYAWGPRSDTVSVSLRQKSYSLTYFPVPILTDTPLTLSLEGLSLSKQTT